MRQTLLSAPRDKNVTRPIARLLLDAPFGPERQARMPVLRKTSDKGPGKLGSAPSLQASRPHVEGDAPPQQWTGSTSPADDDPGKAAVTSGGDRSSGPARASEPGKWFLERAGVVDSSRQTVPGGIQGRINLRQHSTFGGGTFGIREVSN